MYGEAAMSSECHKRLSQEEVQLRRRRWGMRNEYIPSSVTGPDPYSVASKGNVVCRFLAGTKESRHTSHAFYSACERAKPDVLFLYM